MKCETIDVTVNLPDDLEETFCITDNTIEHATKLAIEAYPDWSSMVIVATRAKS